MHSPDALKAALADRYKLLREIGRGGMATVYLARDVRHARQVAIKVLHAELAAVLGAERFLAEITTTANLQHPHILPLFDSGTADGQLFYVMPFIEGETLRARLDRETQLPIADAVQLAREVADALQYAHERGVIHRDIKPENILLQGGHALVADFGIALAVQHAGGQRMTQTGLSLGTPQYMAPEQAMGEKTIDARADIYALGAVTYEMLAGEPPFTGPTAQAIVAKVMTTTPSSLTALRAKVPAHVEAAVQRALDKLPADRFTSARALSEALAGQYSGTAADGTLHSGRAHLAASPGSSTRAATGGVPRWAFAVASCVALLSTGLLMWTRVRPSEAIVPEVIRQPLLPSLGAALLPDAVGVIAISPQGDRVAFVESDSVGEHIVIRRVSETIGRRVVVSRPRDLAFSPDGQSLAFVSDGAVRRVSVDGGAPLTLARLPDGIMRGMTWTKRDTLVLGFNALQLVPATPGNVVIIDSGGRWPVAISPDVVVMSSISGSGRSDFAFRLIAFRLSDRSRTDVGVDGLVPLGVLHDHLLYHSIEGAMMAVPFDKKTLRATGAPRLVLDSVPVGNTNGVNAALSSSGTLIYTRGDQSHQLVQVPLDGSRPLVLGTGRFLEPRYSPDGNRVAFYAGRVNLMSLPSGTIAQLTPYSTGGGQPEWTSDGKRLLYLPDAAGSVARVLNADGSASTDTIIPCPSGLREVVLSGDGQWAICRTFTASQSEIFAVSLKTKGMPVPIVTGRGRAEAPRLSPNGRWLAFQSDAVGGQHEVFVTSFPAPGARVKISTNGGVEPLWDRTGRTLYYRQPGRVLAVGMDPASGARTSEPRVVVSGDYLIHPRNAHQNFDVAPDGRSLLLVRPAAGGPATVVAHHWGEEFRAMLTGGRDR
jgi:serine/threonine-protein kinase